LLCLGNAGRVALDKNNISSRALSSASDWITESQISTTVEGVRNSSVLQVNVELLPETPTPPRRMMRELDITCEAGGETSTEDHEIEEYAPKRPSYSDTVQVLALPFLLYGAVEQTDDYEKLFENVFRLYKNANTRLREQTLNWKKLVVALEGLQSHSIALSTTPGGSSNQNVWECLDGLSAEMVGAAGRYKGLKQEVDNYIDYLREKGLAPLLPERRK